MQPASPLPAWTLTPASSLASQPPHITDPAGLSSPAPQDRVLAPGPGDQGPKCLAPIYLPGLSHNQPLSSPIRYVLPREPSPSPRSRSATCQSAMATWLTCNKNPGHQGSGERPWWVKLRACCHTSLPGGLNAVRVTPLGETVEAGAWSLPAPPASSLR